jgi:curved DNA-binding protein CbpA
LEKPILTEEEKAFQVLGLKKGAVEKEIVSAYRALAKRYHPDVSSKSGQEMIYLNRAYETLRKK